jgi:hypothetical protein
MEERRKAEGGRRKLFHRFSAPHLYVFGHRHENCNQFVRFLKQRRDQFRFDDFRITE